MELKDTIPMMESPDYKERFRAEFFQLSLRTQKLSNTLVALSEGSLPYTPVCPVDILAEQHQLMCTLLGVFEKRAEIEGIDLTMPD